MELTILVIDDDLVSQFATRYCIEQSNKKCNIITCDNGEEGLAVISNRFQEGKESPNIIFLDLVMPSIDGWAFLDILKNTNGWQQSTAIYVLSAFVNSKDRERAKKHPMIQGYFDKPLAKSTLDTIFKSDFA